MAEVVMLGSQEECGKFTAEIAILDQNSKPTFRPEMSLDPDFLDFNQILGNLPERPKIIFWAYNCFFGEQI
jgi:hypothetical protein